jgi:hypothetical protein
MRRIATAGVRPATSRREDWFTHIVAAVTTQPLPLAPDGARSRTLRFADASHPTAVSGALAIHARAATGFTSVHEWPVEAVVRAGAYGDDEVTAELPDVDPVELAHLDDGGVVEVGTIVTPGKVLVGKLTPLKRRSKGEKDPSDALQDAVGLRSGMRDSSLRCPPGVAGTVTAVARDPRTSRELERIIVTVRAERALAVGDVLRVGERTAVVAVIAAELTGDVVWPGLTGELAVEKLVAAELVAHARSIGPYSLATQQPLTGIASRGGQRVTAAELAALREHGVIAVVHELMTVKSDDVDGRLALYESIVRGAPRVAATVPTSLRDLVAYLAALGFDVDATEPAIRIRPMTEATLRALPGPVTKPETINYRTLDCVPDGLFCEAIFGDVKDARRRRTTIGRIDLPAPVLHPWWLDAVAVLLEQTRPQLVAMLHAVEEPPGDWQRAGGWAIAAGLAALDLDAVAAGTGGRAELARAMKRSGIAPSSLALRTWPISPADLRPLVPLDGGRYAISDLNDLYARVIKRANRLARLIELQAPPQVLRNEHVTLQTAIDAVVDNDQLAVPITDPDRRVLASLVGPLRRLLATARTGKRVDYSAFGHAVPCADLAGRILVPRTLAVELWRPFVYAQLEQRGIAKRVKAAARLVDAGDPAARGALADVATGSVVVAFPAATTTGVAPLAALEVALWDEHAFGLPTPTFGAFGGAPVVVHLPIGDAAVAEARALAHPERPRMVREPAAPGWLARAADATDIAAVLVHATTHAEVDVVADDLARTLLGRL